MKEFKRVYNFIFKRHTIFKKSFFIVENVEGFMSVRTKLVLWIENVFNHGLGVCHIVFGVGVVIEELCPSPLLILCVVPFGTYLDDDEDISILVELT